MADNRDEADLGLTPKQEAFALAFFETGNAAEAYRQAYDVAPEAKDGWLYVEASQLLDHPKVALRLAALQKQAESLSMYTRLKALDEYEEARVLAMGEGSPAAAVSAINGKVKLIGLDAPTRTEVKLGGKVQTEEVSALDRINRRLAGLSAAGSAEGDPGGSD